jgi:hypothetical protein
MKNLTAYKLEDSTKSHEPDGQATETHFQQSWFNGTTVQIDRQKNDTSLTQIPRLTKMYRGER